MWLNDGSVEVFIWDSKCCVQWIWIITSCPHLSQQHVSGDDNLNVSIGNYFIPCARKQKVPSPLPSLWVKLLEGNHLLVSPFPTHMPTHFSSEEAFQVEELYSSVNEFDFQDFCATVNKILFYQPTSWH